MAGPGLAGHRIGALLLGASSADAGALGAQLARAAQRDLGLEVHGLGNVDRDEASDRALLHGRSVVELDSGCRASMSLEALRGRLARWRGAPRRVAPAP
jgi:hypothetical protein